MKRLIIIFFCIISVFGFSANVDSVKSRETALKEMQRWFDQGIRYDWGRTDCSHYIQAGMAASGLKLPTGNASNGRYTQSIWNSKTNKIQPGQENLLKPGDLVFFYRKNANGIGHTGMVYSTNDPSCGNGISVIDTYKQDETPRIKCLSKHTGYVGAISHDEIIRANGHTPVNAEGQVLAPVGSAVGAFKDNNKYYDSGYIVDFDGVIQRYVDALTEGVVNIGDTLIVIMTLIFLITFAFKCLKERITNLETIVIELAIGLGKFTAFLIIIRKMPDINKVTLETCFNVAKAFGSNLDNYGVFNRLMTYFITSIEFLVKEFNFESGNIFVNIVKMTTTLINPFKMTVLMMMIFIITGTFGYLMFLMARVIMTYFIATSILVLLIPFWYSEFLQEYIPNPLTIYFKAVIQLFISIIFVSISLGILERVQLKMDGGFDYLLVFTYAMYLILVTFTLKKILKRVSQIV